MLTLFTNITEELTELEKNTLVPMLVDTLKLTHERNRIKGKDLCGWFKASGHQVTEPRIRKMVNYIRVTSAMGNNVLIGASNGYFITRDLHLVDDQIESIQGRIDSMQAVIDSLKAQKESIYHQNKVA